MSIIKTLSVSFAALMLAACASWQAPWSQATSQVESEKIARAASRAEPAPRVATAEAGDSYRFGAGDRVRVVIAGHDALSNSYEVNADGTIALPSIGKVTARGLNTVQLSGAIARRLKQSNMREAHVAVQIETFRPFTIRGDVANPGQYPYVNNMTAETAIAIAGGLKPGTDKNAVAVSGEAQSGIARPRAALNSPVRPGDTITITEER